MEKVLASPTKHAVYYKKEKERKEANALETVSEINRIFECMD